MGLLFSWIVDYHIAKNVPICLKQRQSGQTLPEGTEFDKQDGFLIIENGPQTIDQLVKDELIDREAIQATRTVNNRDNLHTYLHEFGSKDGVHVLDKDHEEMSWVVIFGNKYALKPAAHLLPPHFSGKEKLTEGELGNRTRLAFYLPRALPQVDTYLVRHTTVNGIGTASHFNAQGLAERVYFPPGALDSPNPVARYERYKLGKNGLYTFECDTTPLSPLPKSKREYQPPLVDLSLAAA